MIMQKYYITDFTKKPASDASRSVSVPQQSQVTDTG